MKYTKFININNNNKTLIAIPVYNEATSIEAIVSEVFKYNDNVLIINDGSTDKTGVLLKHHKRVQVITHKINQGYGQSLIDAFEYAKSNGYSWVITMDCDHQHQPLCIPQFLDRIVKSKFDIVSGSRYLLHTNIENVPPDRLRINRQISALLNSALDINITDAFCGFKAYKVNSLDKLKLTEKGYGLPLQLWIQAAFSNLKITEIPVPLIYHDSRRNFGGLLEVPKYRMQYYMKIIKRELAKYGYKDIKGFFSS